MNAVRHEMRQQTEVFGHVDSPWVQPFAPRAVPECRLPLDERDAQAKSTQCDGGSGSTEAAADDDNVVPGPAGHPDVSPIM
jgi:hypothetical protein